MEPETLIKPVAEPMEQVKIAEEPVDHERVIQAVRPTEPEEKTVPVRLRVLEAAVAVRDGALSLLAKFTPSRGQPRPKTPEKAAPIGRPEPALGSVNWTAAQLRAAPDVLTKIGIVKQMLIPTMRELEEALHMLNICGGEHVNLLQGQILLKNQDLFIPVDDAARILSIPSDPIVRQLLLERLENPRRVTQLEGASTTTKDADASSPSSDFAKTR